MSSTRKSRRARPRNWPLQDAKARLSELIRKAQSDGPQHVTVHGRVTVVVLSEEEIFHASRGRAPASGSWISSARRRCGTLRSSIRVSAVPFAMSTCDRLFLLDTNVISELKRARPDERVSAFIAGEPLDRLYLSVVTFAEIRLFGIELSGRRRAAIGSKELAR